MSEKNYIKGFAKEHKFDNGWSIIRLSINLEEANKLPVDKYGNIKIDICQRRNPGKYWETHYMIENTYKKEWEVEQKKDEDNVENDLPF